MPTPGPTAPKAASSRALALLGALALAAPFASACTDDDAAGAETGETSESGGETGELEPEFCPAGADEVEARVDALLETLTLEQKVGLMAGNSLDPIDGLWPTPGIPEAELPGFKMVDGPRGVSIEAGPATAFPVGAARGATFDPALERRVGAAIGREARAKGASVLLAPAVNVLRHPRWGRAQETYGEEPHHIGAMGAAFIEGAQSEHVLASAKHLAVNSLEDNRFTVDVTIDERALREVYLEAFEVAVRDAKVASVMTAYNLVNGAYCAENRPLVREILKEEWGFAGFVESDWVFGTRSTLPSLAAGLDIEMPNANHYGAPLRNAAMSGDAELALIDDAVRRIARTQWCYALDTDPPQVDPSAVETDAHLDLAREVAEASATLLRNERIDGTPALPLDRAALSRIVVVGDLADVENIGDVGSSNVGPSEVVTVLEGLQDAAASGDAQVEVLALDVAAPIPASEQQTLMDADAVVLVTGATSEDEGEGLIAAGDRESLELRPEQVDLIRAVATANPRTVVVLEGGSAFTMESWYAEVPAILMAWYPGARGGEAIARVLFGDVDPGGRSPVSWPVDASDLPAFENTGDSATYDLWHGYRHLERMALAPRFAFGHGLSYTDFALEDLSVEHDPETDELRAQVTVRNAGERPGRTVVQLYAGQLDPTIERSERELEAFAPVQLGPSETETLEFTVSARALSVWDGGWTRPAGSYRVWVGESSADLPLQADLELP